MANFMVTPQKDYYEMLGRGLGEAANTGLNSGLQALANQKLERMQKRNAQNELRNAFPDLPSESVAWIANQPAKQQWEILQALGSERRAQQERDIMAMNEPQSSGLGALQNMSTSSAIVPTTQPQQSEMVHDAQYVADLEKGLATPSITQQMSPEEIEDATNQLKALKEKLKMSGVDVEISASKKNKRSPNIEVTDKITETPSGAISEKEGIKLSDIAKPSKEQRISQHQREQAAKKEQAAINKETQKYYDSVLTTDKAAKEADARLNKMERLVKKGNLPNSALYSALKNIEEHVSPGAGAAAGAAIGAAFGGIGAAPGAVLGGALGALISPITTLLRTGQRIIASDTEEFEKLSNQFISGAKAVFGGRITDQDLKAYMAQIPTLSNTDAGKLKIIEDMKIANKADKIRAQALKDIIKENGGHRPANLQLLVEERIAPQLDKLSQEFVEA